jgi:uncharacterized membrane protein YphA (DoxX/SURF4 family)
MNIALWVVQALLAIAFLMSGLMKTLQYEKYKASAAWVKDVSRGLVTFIGVAEMLGALGLVLPLLLGLPAILTPLAAVGLLLIMLLATGSHLKRGESQVIVTNLVLGALAAFVAYGRWPM